MKFQNMLDDSDETTRYDSSISISHLIFIFPFILSVFDCSWTEGRRFRKGHIHFIMCIWDSGRVRKSRAGECGL